jgi:hypothetical protein
LQTRLVREFASNALCSWSDRVSSSRPQTIPHDLIKFGWIGEPIGPGLHQVDQLGERWSSCSLGIGLDAIGPSPLSAIRDERWNAFEQVNRQRGDRIRVMNDKGAVFNLRPRIVFPEKNGGADAREARYEMRIVARPLSPLLREIS